eukprot:m51a1_g8174 putative ras-related protein rab-1a (258) ;mRNA; f:112724-113928
MMSDMARPPSVRRSCIEIKAGWVVKEGGRVKSWKRRFAVLRGDSLDYYALQRAPYIPPEPPKRAPAGLVCFVLETPGREYIFGTDAGDAERVAWVCALNKTIAREASREYLPVVLLVGDPGAGKSSVAGPDLSSRIVLFDGLRVNFRITEISNRQKLREMSSTKGYEAVKGFAVAFDSRRPGALDGAREWLSCCGRPAVLVGCKCDLATGTPNAAATKLARDSGVPYCECSAVTRGGVEEMWIALATLILEKSLWSW